MAASEKRREKILYLLRVQEKISVEELARLTNSSKETIRRDLNKLSMEGLVEKYHGGAAISGHLESAFELRMHEAKSEKRRIATKAATLFFPNESLFIDCGTTTILFAKELAQRQGLSIITNSLQIASILGKSENDVFMIGGKFRAESEQNLGTIAINQIQRFNALHAVITVGAISTKNVMDYTIEEADMARAMVSQAKKVTVLVDSTKFSKVGLFNVCELYKVDRLITDAAPPQSIIEALENDSVEVIVCNE